MDDASPPAPAPAPAPDGPAPTSPAPSPAAATAPTPADASARASAALPRRPERPSWSSGPALLRAFALLLVFIAFYVAFATGDDLAAVLFAACLLVGAIVVPLTWSTRKARRFNGENNDAVVALGRGQLARAAAVFERWAGRWPPNVGLVARHNLAWTRMRQGQPRAAIELFALNDAHDKLPATGLHAVTALDLALCSALVGELDAAQRWLDEAGRRAREAIGHDVMTAFATAVLDCRRGRHAEAARDLEQRWAEHEAVAAGDVFRPLRIVRAFAVASAGPRDAGKAAALLIKPAYPDELAFLGAAWPEMDTFLAAHDLAGARP